MSSNRLKRPLEPDSVPSVQPVSYTDDDLSSPECLLPMQPVEDDYSSSDEARKKLKLVKTVKRESKRIDLPVPDNLALHKTSHGQDIKAEQTYFYTDVHFQNIGEEVSLEDESLEDCLGYLFKFSSSRFFDEHRCTWNGEKLTDIKEREIILPGLKWLLENDNIDWKSATPEKRSEVEQLHVKWKVDIYKNTPLFEPALYVAGKTKALYDELSSERMLKNMEDRSIRHNTIRACIESIATFISPGKYLRNDMCVQHLDLYVPHDVVTDDSPLIPEGRQVVITSRPDGVFTFPFITLDGQACQTLCLFPVQVYESGSEIVDQHKISPTAVSPQLGLSPIVKPQATNVQNADLESPLTGLRKDNKLASPQATSSPEATIGKDEVSTPRDLLPPKTSLNSLLNPEFVEAARSYIAESLPVHCRMPHCLDKMAGQHVQQLLATATQITIEQKSYFEEGVLEILGLFVVNEYVYFSRLDIKKKLTYFFSAEAFKVNPVFEAQSNIKNKIKAFRELGGPSVSYSNFRLDLTIANHRLALMIFIRNYTCAFINVKM